MPRPLPCRMSTPSFRVVRQGHADNAAEVPDVGRLHARRTFQGWPDGTSCYGRRPRQCEEVVNAMRRDLGGRNANDALTLTAQALEKPPRRLVKEALLPVEELRCLPFGT